MYLRYQQSLKNGNSKPSYLTRKLAPITSDIFSQIPEQDTSYDLDSFCVPDDHVSIYEKKKSSKKNKKSKSKQSREEKLRRIKKLNMTTDDTQIVCLSSPKSIILTHSK